MKTVKVERVVDCSKRIYDQLNRYNKGVDGLMQRSLVSVRCGEFKDPRALAFYIELGDEVIAWTLLFKRPCYKKYSRRRACNIFIREQWRKNGLALKLVEAMEGYCKRSFLYTVYYPGGANRGFFDKMIDNQIIKPKSICSGWYAPEEFHNCG